MAMLTYRDAGQVKNAAAMMPPRGLCRRVTFPLAGFTAEFTASVELLSA